LGELDRIANLLEMVVVGSPYYGPSTLETLKNINAEMAVKKPAWSAHSIWDLVNHITAEMQYALAILKNNAGLWVEGQTTWPNQVDFSDVAWQLSLQELKEANQNLVRAIKQQDDDILDRNPIQVRGPYYLMLHGTLQHAIFHTGQISLLTGQFRN
jgi:uncharacterized damage-inducible protein DinB